MSNVLLSLLKVPHFGKMTFQFSDVMLFKAGRDPEKGTS